MTDPREDPVLKNGLSPEQIALISQEIGEFEVIASFDFGWLHERSWLVSAGERLFFVRSEGDSMVFTEATELLDELLENFDLAMQQLAAYRMLTQQPEES